MRSFDESAWPDVRVIFIKSISSYLFFCTPSARPSIRHWAPFSSICYCTVLHCTLPLAEKGKYRTLVGHRPLLGPLLAPRTIPGGQWSMRNVRPVDQATRNCYYGHWNFWGIVVKLVPAVCMARIPIRWMRNDPVGLSCLFEPGQKRCSFWGIIEKFKNLKLVPSMCVCAWRLGQLRAGFTLNTFGILLFKSPPGPTSERSERKEASASFRQNTISKSENWIIALCNHRRPLRSSRSIKRDRTGFTWPTLQRLRCSSSGGWRGDF